MTDESPIHLERADEFLRDARVLLESGGFGSSISRSYYAAFHGAKAVLFRLGHDRKSHHAVWSAFGNHVAKPGLIEKAFHRGSLNLFLSRIESDYLPRKKDTLEDAQQALSFAAEFVSACRVFVESREMGA
ncbi:MAG: HEPN domain-containing protein [Nitrospinae bacterium]|nr:HEPN domain-containing protein [Nitrospinota bacterium]